ncbi:MAG: N-acyl homoserine lactonase family protein [Solirubrobacterales bacterium]
MSVHADPTPLETPFPGGEQGATVTVEPMVTGRFRSPAILQSSPGGEVGALKVLRSTGPENPAIPIPAFLIRHPKAGNILIDTGLHPSIASDPSENLGRLGAWMCQPEQEAGMDVPARLRERGIGPSAIRLVLLTHLHLDHASAIADFPESTFIVSEPEWKEATSGLLPILRAYRRQQYDYAFDFRTVNFDGANVSSYSSFGRTLDLFGDGSVRLASTPGHTAGHMSVIVRLRNSDLVIAGDALFREEQLRPEADSPGRMQDSHNYRRSLQEIRLFHAQYPEAVITPGHDPAFYENAPVRYE